MNHLRTILSLMIAFLIMSSCGGPKKLNHEDEVSYYVSVWKIFDHNLKGWNNLIDTYNDGYNLSTWNDEGKLQGGRVDTMSNVLNAYIASVDSSITKISAIKEIDKEINLAEYMNTYFDHVKKFCQGGLREAIESFRTGHNNLTDIQRMSAEASDKEQEAIHNEGNELRYKFQKYIDKHRITSEELLRLQGK